MDLAGTEKAELNATASRADIQSGRINTGNHVLQRVLEALASSTNYVPYRDSLLTRLLKPALDSKDWSNTMLTCIQPGEDQVVKSAKVLSHASSAHRTRVSSRRLPTLLLRPLGS